MAVYVDNIELDAVWTINNRVYRGPWCNMVADTGVELQQFRSKITRGKVLIPRPVAPGVAPRRYLLSPRALAQAVALGAQTIAFGSASWITRFKK